ncbi:enoyl-CoA hydratase-related protein [Variovorax sp. KK3]|uniref:enoyl-CoA hydratase-related protein n=1 Tax=Variovorax sp. KK3 TaxID=1855728 RepID=UPI00097C4A34|nr:enoyl-CoA hydratase-related protein [Variovorax sp. KK3]
MNEDLVLIAQSGAVRSLRLNRPDALNSFTSELHAALMAALEAAAADPEVRCVVIGGSGRAFCAGQDLSDPLVAPDFAPGAAPRDLGKVIESLYAPLVMRLRSMPVPVIAEVHGVAAGAGANLALACDLVVAGRSASFIQAFAKIGLVPDTGGTWLLPRLVGPARALGLAMLGDKLPAAEAAEMGLIWKCVDDDALSLTVEDLSHRLAAMPSRALAVTRQALADAQQMDLPTALAREAALQRELGSAADYREGVEAFRAKRLPRFTDR